MNSLLLLAVLHPLAAAQIEPAAIPQMPALGQQVVNLRREPSLLDGRIVQTTSDGPALRLLESEGTQRRLALSTYQPDGQLLYERMIDGALEQSTAELRADGWLLLSPRDGQLYAFEATGQSRQLLDARAPSLFSLGPQNTLSYTFQVGILRGIRRTGWPLYRIFGHDGCAEAALATDSANILAIAGVRSLNPFMPWNDHQIVICRYGMEGLPVRDTLAVPTQTRLFSLHAHPDQGWWLLTNSDPTSEHRPQLLRAGSSSGLDVIPDFSQRAMHIHRSAMSGGFLAVLLDAQSATGPRKEIWWIDASGAVVSTTVLADGRLTACGSAAVVEMTPSSHGSVRLTTLAEHPQAGCASNAMIAELDVSGRWLSQLSLNIALLPEHYRGIAGWSDGRALILRKDAATGALDELLVSAGGNVQVRSVTATFTATSDYALAMGQTRLGSLVIAVAEETISPYYYHAERRRRRSVVALPFDAAQHPGTPRTVYSYKPAAGEPEFFTLPELIAPPELAHVHHEGAWLVTAGRLYGLDATGNTSVNWALDGLEPTALNGDAQGGWLVAPPTRPAGNASCSLHRFDPATGVSAEASATLPGTAGQLWRFPQTVVMGCEDASGTTLVGLDRFDGTQWQLQLPLQQVKGSSMGHVLGVLGYLSDERVWQLTLIDSRSGVVLSSSQFTSFYAVTNIQLTSAMDMLIAWGNGESIWSLERRGPTGILRWRRNVRYWYSDHFQIAELANGDLLLSVNTYPSTSLIQLDAAGCTRARTQLGADTPFLSLRQPDQRILHLRSQPQPAGDSDLALSTFLPSAAESRCEGFL